MRPVPRSVQIPISKFQAPAEANYFAVLEWQQLLHASAIVFAMVARFIATRSLTHVKAVETALCVVTLVDVIGDWMRSAPSYTRRSRGLLRVLLPFSGMVTRFRSQRRLLEAN